MYRRVAVVALFTLVLLPVAALAQGAAEPAKPSAPASGLRAEILGRIADIEGKTVGLAQAIPEEKYSWRPAPGVRSVSEVFMHVAGGNYFLPSFAGVKLPAGVERNMEKTVTQKAKVIEEVKASFAHLKTSLAQTPDAQLDTKVKLFGEDTTWRGVYLVSLEHVSEHLGQQIAYARSNGVTPPWSAGGGD
jgi:uncharacterized damage-inducible protein DinB